MPQPWPDDIRNWYAEGLHFKPHLLTVGAANEATPELEPGRYFMYVTAISGTINLKLTFTGDGDADATDMPWTTVGPGPIWFTVRNQPKDSPKLTKNVIMAKGNGGGTADLVVIKASRDKS